MAKILIVDDEPASGSSSARIYNMRAMRARKPVTALPPCRCCPAAGSTW